MTTWPAAQLLPKFGVADASSQSAREL